MTHEDLRTRPDAHRECMELLPWLVNGRLATGDAQRLESHLEGCEQCRRELAEQQSLYEQINAGDSLVLAPQAGLQKLMARLDDELSGTPELSLAPAPGRATVAARTRAPQWLIAASLVQTLGITALLGVLGWKYYDEWNAPRFSTLTAMPAVTATRATAGSAIVRVVFAPDTELRQAADLLHSMNAQIVAGPSAAGVYTLVLAEEHGQRPDADAAAETMRADPRVVFAEAAVPEAGAK